MNGFCSVLARGIVRGIVGIIIKKKDFCSLIQLSPELSPAAERWKNQAFCMVCLRKEDEICHPTIPRMCTASSSTVLLDRCWRSSIVGSSFLFPKLIAGDECLLISVQWSTRD